MNRLIEHDGISILVELGGVRRMAHKIVRSYYKQKNVLLLEEVERWDLDGIELRISRPVLRRTHWVLGPWRLN